MSPNTDFLFRTRSELSDHSMMASSTGAKAGSEVSYPAHHQGEEEEAEDSSTTSPASAMDWPLAMTPRFSAFHRGASTKDSENNSRERTRLKDVFSCAKSGGRYTSSPPPEPAEGYGVGGGIADNLQIKNNVEVFLDGLVNGFWQCPGGGMTGGGGGDASAVHSNISRTASAANCKHALDSLMTQSTQQMEFQFVPLTTNSKRASHEIPTIPSSSSSHHNTHSTPRPQPSSLPPQPKKATGKMFKRIRVKRGENIGLELFEHGKSVYISKVAKEGTGLKRGMRIIAINDHPCPDSVGEAIELLAIRLDDDGGYVTFVTGEEHDFEAAASVVGEDNNSNTADHGTGNDGDSVSDTHSIRSSMGYV